MPSPVARKAPTASRTSSVAAPPPEPIETGVRRLLYSYAAFLLLLLALHTLFTHRETIGDESGLYNAIYMYQHYGKVTYPMQLQYGYMTIHPPTHYFIVGVLAKLGLHIFHAAGLPPFIIACLAFWAILTSRFRVVEKFAVITGFTLGAFLFVPLYPIRPDMHLTFAWFCGMAFLESARSLGWNNHRLAVGSFFVAYASGLHYPALAAGLILPAYFVYILVRPAGARRWPKLAPIAIGALCFYVPWAVFFVIPDFPAVVRMIRGADPTGGGIRASIAMQWQQFHDWIPERWGIGLPSAARALMAPVVGLHVPPIAWAAAGMLWNRRLRGFVLPGAILPLFIFLFVSRKGGLYYIAPELILYAVATALLFFLLIDWVLRRSKRARVLPGLAVACLLAGVVLARTAPFAATGLTWKLVDWDVSRAANRAMLGQNAKAAINNCYPWYTGGADRTYWVTTQGIDWPRMDRLIREQEVDSMILINDPFGNQKWMIPFPSFYVEGHLQLQAFYFSGRWQDRYRDSLLGILHVTTRRGLPKQGFGYDRARGVLNHYFEDPQGPWVFVTMKATLVGFEEYPSNLVYLERIALESASNHDPGLFSFVMMQKNWVGQRQHFSSSATLLDEVPMRMVEEPIAKYLGQLSDTRIQFQDDGGAYIH